MTLEMTFVGGTRRFRFHVRPLLAPPSDDGLFPADSVIRRVYADSVCMLGAGTALLLQLAHPSIAAGVHEHSDFENHPLDRLFGTLYATSTVVFGSRAQADEIGHALHGVHERVTGPGYRALDPDLLCWVNATLFATAVDLYTRLIQPLSPDELDEFARDSRCVAEVFGCPLESQPATWAEFQEYWQQALSTLTVTEPARTVASSLLQGRGLPLRVAWLPTLTAARAVTAATLPRRLRDEYGLPWRPVDRTVARAMLGAAGGVLPRLPDRWRQLGPQLMRAPEPAPVAPSGASLAS